MSTTDSSLEFVADLGEDAFAARLANLLRHQREQDGLRRGQLAKRSGGRFENRDLRAFEDGAGELSRAAEVAALYGVDLRAILPPRLPVEVDPAGRVATGGVSEAFVPGDHDALLIAYLRLIRSLRRQQRADVIALRRDDVDVLAITLDLPGTAVVERLAVLMDATRAQRRMMVGLFVGGAAVIGLAVTTVAATSGGGPAEPQPPAPTATIESVATVATTVGDEPSSDAQLGEVPGFLEANDLELRLVFEQFPRMSAPAPTTVPPTTPPTTPAPTTVAPTTVAPTAPPTTQSDVGVAPPPVPTAPAPVPEPEPAPTTAPDEGEVEVGPPPVPSPPAPLPDP